MTQQEKQLRDRRRRRASVLRNPTPVELPSGAYRCQVTVCGQRISVTDADPDVAHAKALAMKAELIQKEKRLPQQMTLRQVVENYIASKRPLLSPATLRGYRTILDNRFPQAMQQNPARLTEQQWQAYINQEANRCSAKTLKNAWALISAAVKQESGLDLHVSLPPVVRHARAYLDYEQIPRFVDAVRDQPCELPALLALCSLRRSEIVDLCWQDIDVVRSLIHVDGAAVFGEDEVLIYKETNKNETSQRTVPILIPRIAEIVSASTAPADTRIVSCNPNTLWAQINAVCKRAGLPCVGVHGLRHSFASLAYHLGIPERVAMEIGGWKDNQTMHKIYTHIAQQDIAARAEQLRAFYAGRQDDQLAQKDAEIASLRKQVAELQERLRVLDTISQQFSALLSKQAG